MRLPGMSVELGLASICLVLFGASSAGAIEIEAWSARIGAPGGVQISFSDDFEDGVFDDTFYPVGCGAAPTESGGALVLGAPIAGCQAINANVTVSSPGFLEATFRYEPPAQNGLYGLQLSASPNRFVGVSVSGLGGVLSIGAAEDRGGAPDVLGFTLLAPDLASFAATTLTLRMDFVQSGDDLATAYSFAIDGGAFQSIATSRPGVVDGGFSHAPVLFLNEPFSAPEPGAPLLLLAGLLGASAGRFLRRSALSR